MAKPTVIRKKHAAVTSIQGDLNPTINQAMSIRLSEEPHDSPAQLAERWALSADFIRTIFKDEDGVLVIYRPETLHKRAYSTMRIPRSVSYRVHCRLQSR